MGKFGWKSWIIFWQNQAKKSKFSLFLKIFTDGISTMQILIWTLVFSISKIESIFAKFRPKSSTLFVSPENWPTWYLEDADSYFSIFFWISSQKTIFGQICARKVKFFHLPENWHTWYLKDANSYFNIFFLNIKSKTNFCANLGKKSQISPFAWRLALMVSGGCGFLFWS